MSHRRVKIAAAIAAAVSAGSTSVYAVDDVWTGSVSNNWNDPGNWSLGRVPAKTNGQPAPDDFDDAIVNSTGAQSPLINADLPVTPRDIIVGIGAGAVGQVNHVAGTAATGGGNWLYIGRNGGNGTYNLADPSTTGGTFTGMGRGSGSINVSGRIYVAGATDAAATGVLNVNTTGTITTGNDLNIGAANGTGTVNLDNGTVNVGGWISIGRDENGNSGTGNWNQSGGDVTVAGNTVLGLPGTHGNLNFTGGTLNTTGEMWVGNDVHDGVPSVGVANVSGGTVTVNNWLAVGRNGAQGTLNVSGNAKVVKAGNGHITIGTGTGGNGTVNVSGNGLLSSNADLIVAENNAAAVAVVNQTGGTVAVGGNLDVQRNGTGTYNLSGGTLSVDGRAPDANTDQVTGIDGRQGTFSFTGGRITRSNAGVINYVGDLHVANKAAGFTLNADKTFAVSGVLDVAQGVTFDVTGDALPGETSATQAGSFALGTDNSILGTFDPSTTTVVGLANTPGATFISETAGEGGLFDSSSQSVYWVQENGGQVSLQYSVAPASAPEPASLALLGLSGIALIARRRRR